MSAVMTNEGAVMAGAGQKLSVIEKVAGALLVTIGVLGLLGRTNMLVDHFQLPGTATLLQWWPLLLVVIGIVQLAVFGAGRQAPGKKQ
jgi:hypothetical protein